MTRRPVVPRQLANDDVDAVVAYYVGESAPDAALGFIDALSAVYKHIARHPAAGSARYATELGLVGVRACPLSRYPFLVFYIDRGDHIDVWRVLHAERDIPAWLREPERY
jgi:toxin ParE1/3/4